jgi:ribosomal protein S18 acetylase RimI-like enzyme
MTGLTANKAPTFHIKRIGLTETDLVVDLFDKYRVFYKQPSDMQRARQFITERLENNESVIFVALNDGKYPVGFTQLYPTYSSMRTVKNWILNDLYVDQQYRKQGIGQMLINAAMNFAKANYARVLRLETAADNHTAQRLYEAVGFKKQPLYESFIVYKIDIN